MATQADRIRQFVIENLDRLATRRNGRRCIRAGDVARGLGLSNRLPNICSVLGGRKFQEEAGLRLMDRTGPMQSTTTEFMYEPLSDLDLPPVTPKTPAPSLRPQPPAPSRGDGPSSEHAGSHQADAIRRFVIENLDSLATRRDGRLCIRAGDVARGLGLSNRLPNICSVLRGRKFQEEAGLRLVDRIGPPQSTTTEFVYEPVAGEDSPPVAPKTPAPSLPPRPPAPSRGDGPSSELTDSHHADAIRRFVIENLDSLATRGRLCIRAGDVARGLGLSNRLPDIGSVLGGGKFHEEAGLRLVGRTGPLESTTTEFVYEPVAGEDSPPIAPTTSAPPLPPPPAMRSRGAGSSSEYPESHDAVLCLVSCVARKGLYPAPAKSLYISDWFIKARQVVEMEGWRWLILSAKYGLVDPDRQIEPYEKTLNNMSTVERRSWSSEVWKALERHLDGVRTVVFFAGQKYREDLEPRLRGRGIEVRVPMEGQRIGEQLASLNRRLTRSTPGGAEELDPRPRGGGVEVQAQSEAPRVGERQARPMRPSTRPATPGTDPRRLADTVRFYELLGKIEERVGGCRRLADCDGSMDWPERGVYFFFEEGEKRSGSGTGDRVVRVGTHALKSGSKATLCDRLRQHRGPADGCGGNHRGSIFRKLVGVSLARRGACVRPRSWGVAGSVGEASRKLDLTPEAVKEAEADLEQRVSAAIGAMSVLWLSVPDAPGPESARGCIERGAIALLSNAVTPAADQASANWLGAHCDRPSMRASGLWNNNHVEETYEPDFLDKMEALIATWG